MSMSHSSAPPDGREVSTTHTLLLTKSDSVTVILPGEKEAVAAVRVCVCVCGGEIFVWPYRITQTYANVARVDQFTTIKWQNRKYTRS